MKLGVVIFDDNLANIKHFLSPIDFDGSDVYLSLGERNGTLKV